MMQILLAVLSSVSKMMLPEERKIFRRPACTTLTKLPQQPISASNAALTDLLQSKQLNIQPKLLTRFLLTAGKEPLQLPRS